MLKGESVDECVASKAVASADRLREAGLAPPNGTSSFTNRSRDKDDVTASTASAGLGVAMAAVAEA